MQVMVFRTVMLDQMVIDLIPEKMIEEVDVMYIMMMTIEVKRIIFEQFQEETMLIIFLQTH